MLVVGQRGECGGIGHIDHIDHPPTVLSGMARRGEKPKLPSYGGKSPPQRGIDLPPGLSEAGRHVNRDRFRDGASRRTSDYPARHRQSLSAL
ncbi:cytochrome P450 domain protein [Mycobacterium ulcerans str. Harvey]|uniref:Cytochrome P450 domain protein n=1 Tax=Mycobacterium ulcerans str. Harvey TaxID=1299332 RepID=A0ABN0QWC2_MYCUL|nr:cytochrome P450 domain protein [Mycobacterium ulcerans str. Harvey]